MGHSFGDGIIAVALSAAFVAWMYFKHMDRRRRLEIVHQERLAAMDKGIPLPELPLEEPKRPPDPREPLLHGLVWCAMGFGGMGALAMIGPLADGRPIWALPLPLVLLGLGLVLYYALASGRAR
jgi:hypothetical protein